MDDSDIFIFSARGRGRGSEAPERVWEGSVFIENPRREEEGGRGAGRVSAGANNFFSGPKCPPSFGTSRSEDQNPHKSVSAEVVCRLRGYTQRDTFLLRSCRYLHMFWHSQACVCWPRFAQPKIIAGNRQKKPGTHRKPQMGVRPLRFIP